MVSVPSDRSRSGETRNVLFVSCAFHPEDTPDVLRILATGLDRHSWNPLLALPAPGEAGTLFEHPAGDVKLLLIETLNNADIRTNDAYDLFGRALKARVDQLAEVFDREQIDLVITAAEHGFEGALAAKLAGVPHVWVLAEGYRPGAHPFPQLDSAAFYTVADALSERLIILSNETRAQSGRYFPSSKIEALYLDVRPKDTPAQPEMEQAAVGGQAAFSFEGFTSQWNRLLAEVVERPASPAGERRRLVEDTIHLVSAANAAQARMAELNELDEADAAINALLAYPKDLPVKIAPLTRGVHWPRVSICIPVYNGAPYLDQCIQSILAQSYDNLEMIFVDDASTDDSAEIIRSYHDPRISYARNEHTLGLIGNWNRCLELSRGEYVCIFHQDDRMLPGNLEQKTRLLDAEPQVGLVYSDVQIVDAAGAVKSEHWFELTTPNIDALYNGRTFFDLMFTNLNLVCCPSVLARRACYEQVGGFDPRLPFTGDMEMWMRAAIFYDIAYLAQPLIQYRVHDNNETQHHLTWSLIHLYLCKKMLLEKYPDKLDSAYQKLLVEDSARRVFARVAYLYQEQQYATARQYLAFLDKIRGANAVTGSLDLYHFYTQQLSRYVDQASMAARLQQSRAELELTRAEVESYTLSKSWRITRPLREFGRFIRGEKDV